MRLSDRPLLRQLVWHVLAILIFLCLPLLKWKAPWWELPKVEQFAIVGLIAGYAAAALAVMIFARAGTPRAFSRALALALSIFGLCLLVLTLARLEVPRYLLLAIFLAFAAMAPFVITQRPGQLAGIAVLAVALLAIAGLGPRRGRASTRNREDCHHERQDCVLRVARNLASGIDRAACDARRRTGSARRPPLPARDRRRSPVHAADRR